jgi:DNA (cytosine-5)-methyltransferase 1
MTVTLSNYDIKKNSQKLNKWLTSVQYGNGEGYFSINYKDGYFDQLTDFVLQQEKGIQFLSVMNNGFNKMIGTGKLLQEMYETRKSLNEYLEPTLLINKVKCIIDDLETGNAILIQGGNKIFRGKENIPLKQFFALYAINKIASIANEK